jgi:hypothetical protein
MEQFEDTDKRGLIISFFRHRVSFHGVAKYFKHQQSVLDICSHIQLGFYLSVTEVLAG